jgi:DNA-binding response OmpR family regulator
MTTVPDRTVVLAEDYLELRDITRLRLEEAGFEVYCTCLVSEIIELVQKNQARFLILDLQLKDGISVDIPRQIRTLPWYVNVIVVTGYSDAYPLKEMIDSGADDYFQKNYSVDDLISKMRRMLEKENRPTNVENRIPLSTGEVHLDRSLFIRADGEGKPFNSLETRLLRKLWENYPNPIQLESLMLFLFSVSSHQDKSGKSAHNYFRKIVQSVREISGYPDVIFHDRKSGTYRLRLAPEAAVEKELPNDE